MSTTIEFDFGNNRVRAINDNEVPWFVAKDVCRVLELANVTEAIKYLDEDEKNTVRIAEGIRGNPNLSIISESGLYALIFRSRKPQARAFQKWVTSVVLPAIRKTGTYTHQQAPNFTAQQIADLSRRVEALEGRFPGHHFALGSDQRPMHILAELMHAKRITPYRLASLADLTKRTVYRHLSGERMFRSTAYSYAKVLGVDPGVFAPQVVN